MKPRVGTGRRSRWPRWVDPEGRVRRAGIVDEGRRSSFGTLRGAMSPWLFKASETSGTCSATISSRIAEPAKWCVG